MTKEELENKLKISENTCIHCPTLELKKQVLNIFHQLGLKWCDGTHYTICTKWDSREEDTVYYPFDGEFSSLEFACLTGYEIINAEDFIALHTEGKEFDLENYEPKGELTGFPKEVIARMLECQEEQSKKRDVTIFENNKRTSIYDNGFAWEKTKEKWWFWNEVIRKNNFNLFFTRYPKQDNQQNNSQEFRVGDKVIYYLTNKIGILTEIKKHKFDNDIDIVVDYGNNDISEYEIRSTLKRPFLLHYRDDYNYDVIDFNNLPKRQAPKRWRAEIG